MFMEKGRGGKGGEGVVFPTTPPWGRRALFVMDSPAIIPQPVVEVCGSGETGSRSHRQPPCPRDAAWAGESSEARSVRER
jgi:hypothetical protein